MRCALPLLLLFAALGPPAAAAPAQDVRELLRQVKKLEDDVPPNTFGRIAARGDEEALKVLESAISHLKQEHVLRNAYSAFRAFATKGELADGAVQFLRNEALRHRRDENQRAACAALAAFGPEAHAALEQIVRKHKDEALRATAVMALLTVLAERGDQESFALIFDNAPADPGRSKGAVRSALARGTSDEVLGLYAKKLSSSKTPLGWRRLLIEVLAERKDRSSLDLVARALTDVDAHIRMRAIEALGLSGDVGYVRELREHIESKDAGEQREAILAVGRLSGADADWVDELMGLARDKEIGARMGAAAALLVLRTPDAVAKLHDLLEDTSWQVRAEALQQVGNLRRKESIPLLIERMDRETGRLQRDISSVLRLVTGLDHGTQSARWRAWWAGEGERYDLPSYEQAVAAERARNERRGAGATQSTFYGLEVVSDRVTFVLDHSGSMNAAAGSDGRSRSDASDGPTRLDVAKQELEKALNGLADEVLFNIVFFETRVSPWRDDMIETSAKTREAAIAFTRGQRAAGGTNIYDALLAAYDDPRVDTIYLLSDGSPTAGSVVEPGEIRERINRLNRTRKIQINCISIGTPSPFLRGLANDTGGSYTEAL
jgi:HEAT repeat protein